MPRTIHTIITATAAAAAIALTGATTATADGLAVDPGPHKPNTKIKLRKPVYRWRTIDTDTCKVHLGGKMPDLVAKATIQQRVTNHGVQRRAVLAYTSARVARGAGAGVLIWPRIVKFQRSYPAGNGWSDRASVNGKTGKEGNGGSVWFTSLNPRKAVKLRGDVYWRVDSAGVPMVPLDLVARCHVNVYAAPYRK